MDSKYGNSCGKWFSNEVCRLYRVSGVMEKYQEGLGLFYGHARFKVSEGQILA